MVVAAHPGGLKVPNDFDALKKPTLLVLSEKDFEYSAEKQEAMVKLVKEKGEFFDGEIYPGVTHGFAG